MLSFDQLTCFVALAEQGSFHGAAASLNCSQPTISHRLKRLEDDLQAVLIQRGRSGCQLSVAGSRFLPLARSILAIAQQANRVVKNQTVRVAACSNIGIYSMPPLIASFSSEHKRHDVCEFWLGSNPEVHERLIRAEADVAIMEWWQETDGFKARVFAEDPMVLIMPPGHELSRRRRITRDDLVKIPLLGGERGTGTGRLLRTIVGERAGLLQSGASLGSTEAVKRAVRAGLGVSVVLASSVRDEVANGVLKTCPIDIAGAKKSFYLAHRSDLHAQDMASLFSDYLAANGARPVSANNPS